MQFQFKFSIDFVTFMWYNSRVRKQSPWCRYYFPGHRRKEATLVTTSGVHASEIPDKNPGSHSNPEPGVGAISTATRESILAALEETGWGLDSHEPHVIEASDGEQRYGVAVFFEWGVPVEICYGDGEEDLQFCEEWHEAPGILAPKEVARLFGDEQRSGK